MHLFEWESITVKWNENSSVDCFFLSAFLYSKPFQNNLMHCIIIDSYFNIFFIEIQLKKEKLKGNFWLPEFGGLNWYIGLTNGLNMLLTS